MAHPKSKRMALRSAYCYKALSLEEAASLVGISIGTARRWKADAQRAEDDDWDKVKAASSLAGEGMEAVARQMLNDYVLQHRTLMERIGKDEDMPPAEKVEALSSLADSFAKTIAASKRILPETDELATALGIIRKLVDFTSQRFPQHARLGRLSPRSLADEKALGKTFSVCDRRHCRRIAATDRSGLRGLPVRSQGFRRAPGTGAC